MPKFLPFHATAIGILVTFVASCTGGTTPTGAGGASGAGGGSAGGTPATGALAPRSLVRRLSQEELDNTLEDILGDVTRPAQKFLSEDEFNPFDNDYSVQAASRSYSDNLRELARDVAERALADTKRRSLFVPCVPSGPGDAACFRMTVEKLGRRLLRRPLSSAEVDAYVPLQKFATEATDGVTHDFYTAVALALRAFLQDPEFFNRVEVGRETATANVYALDSFAIATRMSYLLWGSTPDDELLQVAAQDGLVAPATRALQATRLLKTQRARLQQHRFHAQWLGYRAIPHPPATAALFSAETNKLLDEVIFDSPSSYFDIFTQPRTYVTTALAASYGLPPPAGGEGWVNYGATSPRAGILSHGAVLAAFSKFSDTSPTQRGLFVQTRLLCNAIASPPANVNVDQPPGDPDQECKTPRYQAHMDQSGCKTCHSQMDPIGFGLEQFDIAGKLRTHDNDKPQCALSGQGAIPDLGTFSGPKELAAKLLAAGEISDCLVRQYLAFALGRTLKPDEEPLVTVLMQSLAQNDNHLSAMLAALVSHSSFALRQLEESP